MVLGSLVFPFSVFCVSIRFCDSYVSVASSLLFGKQSVVFKRTIDILANHIQTRYRSIVSEMVPSRRPF